jgi:hypothetical protein
VVYSVLKRLVVAASLAIVTVALVRSGQASAGATEPIVNLQPSSQSAAAAVRQLPPGTQVTGDPGKKGDTYYWLESQTVRLTARFEDATVTASRSAAEIRATVRDASGNEIAHLNATSASLQYVPASAEPFSALNDSHERPTLDWASRQAFALVKDGTKNLRWKNGLMQPVATSRDLEPLELETQWANGLVAKLMRKAVRNHTFTDIGTKKERVLSGPAYFTQLSKDGVAIGQSAWFVRDRVFIYKLPSLGLEGYIAPEHLVPFGKAWPFVPDTTWLNLQTIAFYHFKTLIDAKGFVARDGGGCGQRQTTLARTVLDLFEPTLHADEPGCDGLHWLDGSVYRFCCDIHDACFARYGCDWSSWWTWWKSWSCDFCNMNVIMCFAGGGCSCMPGYGQRDPTDDGRSKGGLEQT